MHTKFRWFIAVSIPLFLSLTSAPPTLAQTMEMPSPTPDFGPLAPPCETNPNGASCGSGLDQPTTPIDDAIKLVEEEIKRLEDARKAAQNCLKPGDDATCEALDIPSGTDCPQGAPSGDCTDPLAPANAASIDKAIKFIEGLLQDPETDTPPPGYLALGPDGKPIVDMEKMLQEALDRIPRDQSCAAIAKLQAQKEQMEFELGRTKNQIFEIQTYYTTERATIGTTETNFEETFRDLQRQLETTKRLQQEYYRNNNPDQSQNNFINQSFDRINDLKILLSQMTASRERIHLSGAERRANSYKNYLTRVVPQWNKRLSLTSSLQSITEQIRQLSASCE